MLFLLIFEILANIISHLLVYILYFSDYTKLKLYDLFRYDVAFMVNCIFLKSCIDRKTGDQ